MQLCTWVSLLSGLWGIYPEMELHYMVGHWDPFLRVYLNSPASSIFAQSLPSKTPSWDACCLHCPCCRWPGCWNNSYSHTDWLEYGAHNTAHQFFHCSRTPQPIPAVAIPSLYHTPPAPHLPGFSPLNTLLHLLKRGSPTSFIHIAPS